MYQENVSAQMNQSEGSGSDEMDSMASPEVIIG